MTFWNRFGLDRFIVVRNCLVIFYLVSVLFGFSLHVYDRTKKRLVASKLITVYSFALAIIPCLSYKIANQLLTLEGERKSIVASVVDSIESLLLIQSLVFGTLRRFRTWKETAEIFEEIFAIANGLGYPLRTVVYVVMKRMLKKVVIGFTLLIVPVASIAMQKYQIEQVPIDWIALLVTMYPKVMIVNATGLFYGQVMFVGRFFEILNQKLGTLHQEVTRELAIISFGKSSNLYTEKLRQIVILRERVYILAQRLNKAYSYQMLIIFTLISILILNQFYFLSTVVNRYARYSEDVSARLSVAVLFMCILNFHEAYKVADACEQAIEESRATADILHKFNALNINPELKKNIEMFLIQLLHHPLKFTACGMFSLDYTVIFSIITSTASYLIILMQFDLADNGNRNCTTV
ncbi:gustatory receptor for bitter taste 22e-like [Culex quinquefasciatus]|uniref:gustatory receptor for bitter taste 22e-like n=1 Tax=Culex quinquefasciatus TaxID=7176 RepID=UPI0018E3E604|nr:gustatory receptor for bitter taste 22e-like [Culex quinquefasciatus]